MKEIRERFLQKVRKSGSTYELNLSVDDDYQHLMDVLGGDELLKEKFPDIHKAIANTKSQHQEKKARGYDSDAAARAIGTVDNYTNSSKIRYTVYDAATEFATASSIHRTSINPSMVIISTVYDKTNNKKIDGFAITDTNKASLEGRERQPSRNLISSQDKEFVVESTFICESYDDANNSVFETTSMVSDVIKVKRAATLVKKIVVDAPFKKSSPIKPNIIIVYDRGAQVGENYDYYFPLVSQGMNIRVQIPFEGSVEFDKSVQPKFVDPASFKLQLEHPNFGVIKFKAFNPGLFTYSNNKLSWKFPTDWGTLFNKKSFVSGIGFNFYCEMNIMADFNGMPLNVPIPVVISSDNLDHADPAYRKISPIDIYWGCMGKDTKVKMADGSMKLVSEIKPGDLVLGAYGESTKVVDIMTGTEKSMVRLETKSGEVILLTKDHPILTERGMVMAKDIFVGDVFVLENKKSFLASMYEVDYNDTVYSIALDKPNTSLIGNGFIVGDFDAQQKAVAEATKIETTEIPLTPLQEAIISRVKEINEELKRPE